MKTVACRGGGQKSLKKCGRPLYTAPFDRSELKQSPPYSNLIHCAGNLTRMLQVTGLTAASNADCNKWNLYNSFFFSFTAITTIGQCESKRFDCQILTWSSHLTKTRSLAGYGTFWHHGYGTNWVWSGHANFDMMVKYIIQALGIRTFQPTICCIS